MNRNLRELYASYNWDQTFYLDVGRQIVVWGRADGINPTDNLSPRDYTRLVPDETDQRLGNDAIKLTYIPESGTNKWTALLGIRVVVQMYSIYVRLLVFKYDVTVEQPAFAMRGLFCRWFRCWCIIFLGFGSYARSVSSFSVSNRGGHIAAEK